MSDIYILMSEDGQNIRKWSHAPFEGATRLSDRNAVLDECAHKLGERARQYRLSMLGIKLGEAMFQTKMADELDAEAAAIRGARP